MKRISSFVFRIDTFNRIIVFVSVALFLVFPSWVLYQTKSDNYTFSNVMASILLLGIIIGNGLLVLYRPLKTTWLYFLIDIICFPFLFFCYDFSNLNLAINELAIFWISYIYCILGFLINLLYLIHVLRQRNRSEMDEKTNNDTFFDFLGGKKKNREIEEKIDTVDQDDLFPNARKKIKNMKFSRLSRLVSFGTTFVSSFIYLFLALDKSHLLSNMLAVIMMMSLLVLPISIVASILYPVDFKYVYYFNAMFFSVTGIISCGEYEINPLMLIISSIIVGLSFLLTLIVEGRTWTGSAPD